MTKDEMSLLVAEQVKAALTAELQQLVKPAATGVSSPGEGEDKNEFDVLALLNMGDTTETVVGAFKEQMLAQYDAMQKRAAQEAAEMVARIKRDSDIAEFTQSVINGNDDVPYGLPVDGKDLQEFLGRLSHADLEFAKNLIGRLHREGRTHFRELGHGRQMQGATQLEPAIKKLLKAHVKAGGDIEEWFAYAGIGEMSQYDLSDFAER